MSNAVPWSDRRAEMGMPSETLTVASKSMSFIGMLALIVVHGDDQVEFAAQAADEDGVGRVGPVQSSPSARASAMAGAR